MAPSVLALWRNALSTPSSPLRAKNQGTNQPDSQPDSCFMRKRGRWPPLAVTSSRKQPYARAANHVEQHSRFRRSSADAHGIPRGLAVSRVRVTARTRAAVAAARPAQPAADRQLPNHAHQHHDHRYFPRHRSCCGFAHGDRPERGPRVRPRAETTSPRPSKIAVVVSDCPQPRRFPRTVSPWLNNLQSMS